MHAELRMTLAESTVADYSADLQRQRMACGFTVEAVARQLLLSAGQVRGLECGSTQPFYNERFFDRALQRYGQFLSASVAALGQQSQQQAPEHSPEPLHSSDSPLRLTIDPAIEPEAPPRAVAPTHQHVEEAMPERRRDAHGPFASWNWLRP